MKLPGMSDAQPKAMNTDNPQPDVFAAELAEAPAEPAVTWR